MKRFKQRRVRRSLKRLHKELLQHYPQLAFFNYDLLGRCVACEGYHEIHYLKCLAKDVFPKLKSHNICLDIGANIGNHSVFFADYFKKIYAYEPNLRPFKLLEANAMLKNNIKPFNFGLSNATKKQKVVFSLGNIGSASLVHNPSKGKTDEAIFELKYLDKVLTQGEISKISFMKIDVEGHELNVLKGAIRTIKASKPIIALEVLPDEIQNGSFATKEFLETLGYKFFYVLQPKPILNLIPSPHGSIRDRILTEAPKKFPKKYQAMVICSSYDLKA